MSEHVSEADTTSEAASAAGTTRDASGTTAGSAPRGSGRRPRRRRRRITLRSVAVPLVSLVVFLGSWDLVVRSGLVLDLILPPPGEVAGTLYDSAVSIITGGSMQHHFLTTLTEILVGFAASVVIGAALALLMSEFRVTREALYPYVIAMNATPTIALAPLFVVWFGVGVEAKIILIITGATFPVIVSTMAGLLSTSDEMLRLMRSLGATRWEIFVRVRLQSSLPYFFAGLELAIVSASIGAVVGEFTGGNAGLGYVTLLAQDTYNLKLAFATLIILALLGIILHRCVVALRDVVVFWAPGKNGTR